MTWKANIENLVRIGQLKRTEFIDEDVRQYVKDASGYFRDANLVTTPQSRFLLAYEGLHALSMGSSTKRRLVSTVAKGIARPPSRPRC